MADQRATLPAALALGCLGLTAALAGPAAAQSTRSPFLQSEIPFDYSRGRNTSVTERARPDFQAGGIRSGAFLVYPRVEAGIAYTDNVFGSGVDEKSDTYFTVNPSVTVRSNWSRHSLNLEGGARLRRYSEEDTADQDGLYAEADLRLDANRTFQLFTGAAIRQLYEEPSSSGYPDDVTEAVEFVQSGVYGRGVFAAAARVRMILAGDYHEFDFEDSRNFAGAVIDQDGRDQAIWRVSARGEYGLTPETSLFLQATYSESRYEEDFLFGLPARDGEELRVLAGASFDLTAVTRGSIGVGLVEHDYDSALYGKLDGVVADARVEYFPTGLTTLTLTASRSVYDSVIGPSGGYFSNGVGLRVDHELLRNLLLNAEAGYRKNDFDSIDREDEITSFTAGARYLANRSIGVGAAVSHVERDSSGLLQGRSFDETRAMLTLVAQR
jgi:hypothetical protein